MKIAIAQANFQIGNFSANTEKILSLTQEALKNQADLIVFPELALSGYPPIDLLDRPYFWEKNQESLKTLFESFPEHIGVIFGALGEDQKNTAYFFNHKTIESQDKSLLPTYDVFDETRYFKPAQKWETFDFKGKKICLTVCEDIWDGYDFHPYDKVKGYDLLVNISASPFEMGKLEKRISLLSEICKSNQCAGIYVNLIGANDELIFDGRSFAVDNKGNLAFLGEGFKENLYFIDTEKLTPIHPPIDDSEESLYNALVLGIKDYFAKTGFRKAILGLSGGIDSALAAVLAADALGKENVTGILMPGPYSSQHSIDDAKKLGENLGIETLTVPIKEAYDAMRNSLASHFKDLPFGLAEENLQARLRGNVLMTYSNKFNSLVLATGNKSELSVGYCTLYGDMCGALAIIGDIYKTQVYKLSQFINLKKERIPLNTIQKPPSAELRPNQKDQDSLPPYDILDQILYSYLQENLSPEEIGIKYQFSKELVEEVIKKILTSEYKRRQAPLVLKVSSKAFGSGRRIPLSSKLR